MSKYKPLESILVKPAGPDCNLGCKYCFYLEKKDLFKNVETHRMSDKVLEEMIRQLMEQSGPNVAVGWQGGEPTLMGIDFYRKAVQFETKYGKGKSVGNGLQTNGLLLNEEWADFLNEYNFLVGLSLDGPEHIHDRHRLTQNDKPSHAIVEKNAKMLLDKGVAVNAMCCVTNYSSQYAEELYYYYKNLGFTWMQFIPIVETDKDNPKKAAPFSVTDIQYGEFLIELFDLWIADFVNGMPTTNIRHFDSVFHAYVGVEAPECALKRECGVYTVVEHNGDLFSCDFFVEPKYRLGNIMNTRLIDALNSVEQQKFGAMKAKLPRKCGTCKWYRYCYGGCTKDRIKDPRDNAMPRFCKSYTMFQEYADPVFKQLAQNWKENQQQMQQLQRQVGDKPTYDAFGDFVK